MVINEKEIYVWTIDEIKTALKRNINYHPRIGILKNSLTSHKSPKIEESNNQDLRQTPIRNPPNLLLTFR
ncbi:hypothetical protein Golomagni_05757 [Golovinomyces magnicellulatus]|nr:hypothetical protein Golomagni_05757 [Golovinomyces magnicellulatus]